MKKITKVLFLASLFIFCSFINNETKGEAIANYGIGAYCVDCGTFNPEANEDEGFRCIKCGLDHYGTIYVVPDGYVYCPYCHRAIPVDLNVGHC